MTRIVWAGDARDEVPECAGGDRTERAPRHPLPGTENACPDQMRLQHKLDSDPEALHLISRASASAPTHCKPIARYIALYRSSVHTSATLHTVVVVPLHSSFEASKSSPRYCKRLPESNAILVQTVLGS
eukprot:1640350-Rhodomonas_salina.1